MVVSLPNVTVDWIGTRPFECNYGGLSGCFSNQDPRGFLRLRISELNFADLISGVVGTRAANTLAFNLRNVDALLAFSPQGTGPEDKRWDSYKDVGKASDWTFAELFEEVFEENGDAKMVPNGLQHAKEDGLYLKATIELSDENLITKIKCFFPYLLGLDCAGGSVDITALLARDDTMERSYIALELEGAESSAPGEYMVDSIGGGTLGITGLSPSNMLLWAQVNQHNQTGGPPDCWQLLTAAHCRHCRLGCWQLGRSAGCHVQPSTGRLSARSEPPCLLRPSLLPTPLLADFRVQDMDVPRLLYLRH